MQSPTRRTHYPKNKHSTLDGGNFPDAEALKLCSGFVNNHKCRYAISYRFAIATMTNAMRNALTPPTAISNLKASGSGSTPCFRIQFLEHAPTAASRACVTCSRCETTSATRRLGWLRPQLSAPAGATSHMMTTVIVSQNSPVARVDKVLCQLRRL